MNQVPEYIKKSERKISHTWKESNPTIFSKFVELGENLSIYNCSIYLIGSAAGIEENEKVGDVDVVIFVGNINDLIEVELLTRPYKHLEGTDLTIRFQFYPKSFINPYNFQTGFDPKYYTALKTVNQLIYGDDVLAISNWLDEAVVKDYAKKLAVEGCLMIFRIVNKQKWNDKQNAMVMQNMIGILLNLGHNKGFFGYSKTEIYSLVNQTYNFKNNRIPELMLKDKISGTPTFYEQDPLEIQTEALKFCEEVLLILHRS